MAGGFVSVYRTGALTPAPDAGAATDVTAAADLHAPPGRQPRIGALFAAPTLAAAARWVRGNALTGLPTTVHELRVPASATWCYPVQAWEDVSWRDRDPRTYWGSGMTLTRWLDSASDKPEDWEVLTDPAQVRSHRPVSTRRLLAAVEDPFWRDQTAIALRRNGRAA